MSLNSARKKVPPGYEPAKSKCCNAAIRAEYKKLIPNTTVISNEVDYFYCTGCRKKVSQSTFEPLE